MTAGRKFRHLQEQNRDARAMPRGPTDIGSIGFGKSRERFARNDEGEHALPGHRPRKDQIEKARHAIRSRGQGSCGADFLRKKNLRAKKSAKDRG